MSGTQIVLGAVLVIWLGVFLYLLALDRKIQGLARKVERNEK